MSLTVASSTHDRHGRDPNLTFALRIRRRLAVMIVTTFFWSLPSAIGVIATVGESMARENLVSGTGTVRFNPLEGGFFQIKAERGAVYTPTSGLPAQYCQDGLRVRFVGRLRPEVASIYMSGASLDLIEIRPE